MEVLEPSVKDFAFGFLKLCDGDAEISFGRIQREVDIELSD